MKTLKYLITLFALCALLSAPSLAQSYDSVAAFTNITIFGATDLAVTQTKVSNAYAWRKITGLNFWAQVRDTTEAYGYAGLSLSNSFTGINDFDGATFNAGAHGTVTMDDSVLTGGLWTNWLHARQAVSYIGWLTDPFLYIWTKNLVIVNDEENDSVTFSYDDSLLTIDKPTKFTQLVTLGDDLGFDSSYAMKNTVYKSSVYTIANTGDSVLIIYADSCALIELSLPGNVTNLENIVFEDAAGLGKGAVIRIWHKAINTVFFEDAAATEDGVMQLAGDFTMGAFDYLELLHFYTGAYWSWIEISRSNN